MPFIVKHFRRWKENSIVLQMGSELKRLLMCTPISWSSLYISGHAISLKNATCVENFTSQLINFETVKLHISGQKVWYHFPVAWILKQSAFIVYFSKCWLFCLRLQKKIIVCLFLACFHFLLTLVVHHWICFALFSYQNKLKSSEMTKSMNSMKTRRMRKWVSVTI